MRIAITTPTGQIGSKVVHELLDPVGHQVVLLVRDPTKVMRATDHGATLKIGDLEDEGFVRRATEDVDALFWLTPPNMAALDPREFQRKLAHNAANAIVHNKIKRVVNLSSIGAQHKRGTGPIAGQREIEITLTDAAREVGADIMHLRAPFFMENYLAVVPSIRLGGHIPLPVTGDVKTPMIATNDVAARAAQALAHEPWSGTVVRELLGPREYTFAEAAEIIGRAVGKRVDHVTITADQTLEIMGLLGASDAVAASYVEMFDAMQRGMLKPTAARTPENTTPTTLEDFARQRLEPAVRTGNVWSMSYALA